MSTTDEYKAELDRLLTVFGGNIRRRRLALRPSRSQEQISHATLLHRTAIGRLEQGLTEPRLSTLLILADGLRGTVDDLLDGLWVPTERRPSPTGSGWT